MDDVVSFFSRLQTTSCERTVIICTLLKKVPDGKSKNQTKKRLEGELLALTESNKKNFTALETSTRHVYGQLRDPRGHCWGAKHHPAVASVPILPFC